MPRSRTRRACGCSTIPLLILFLPRDRNRREPPPQQPLSHLPERGRRSSQERREGVATPTPRRRTSLACGCRVREPKQEGSAHVLRCSLAESSLDLVPLSGPLLSRKRPLFFALSRTMR